MTPQQDVGQSDVIAEFHPPALGDQLNVGQLHINDQTVNDECTNPFGGPGVGGNGGSVGGPADIDEYTQWQWITVKDAPPAFPF